MKLDFDVAVVGASSSGLYAAARLARAGKRVGVFERQPALQPARRTLIITPQLLQLLPEVPPPALLHRVETMRVATPQAITAVTLAEPDLIIERGHFARHLAREAAEAGAALFYDHRFADLQPELDGASLRFRTPAGERVVRTGAVIGADGVTSETARAARLPLPLRVPIVQAEVRLPAKWDPAASQVWFDVAETRYFYWLIPESAEHGVVGLVGDGRQNTQALLLRFLNRLGLQPLAYQGAQIAMHHPRLRPWGQVGGAPVLLVGDAAGQVKVTTVGGTVSGMWGAAAAARALLQETPYPRALRALKRELDLHWLLRLLLERLDNPGYDRLVRAINPALQSFLAQHNRDAMARVIWQLPLLQPRLLTVGFHILLNRAPRYAALDSAPLPGTD